MRNKTENTEWNAENKQYILNVSGNKYGFTTKEEMKQYCGKFGITIKTIREPFPVPCQIHFIEENTDGKVYDAYTVPARAKDGVFIKRSNDYSKLKEWLTANGYKIIHCY